MEIKNRKEVICFLQDQYKDRILNTEDFMVDVNNKYSLFHCTIYYWRSVRIGGVEEKFMALSGRDEKVILDEFYYKNI